MKTRSQRSPRRPADSEAAADAEPLPDDRSASPTSRRAFLRLAALGSAAVVLPARASRVRAAVRKAAAATATAEPSRSPALAKEIARQKKATADLLKTIRDFELPPGGEQAFVFAPLRRAESKSKGGAR